MTTNELLAQCLAIPAEARDDEIAIYLKAKGEWPEKIDLWADKSDDEEAVQHERATGEPTWLIFMDIV